MKKSELKKILHEEIKASMVEAGFNPGDDLNEAVDKLKMVEEKMLQKFPDIIKDYLYIVNFIKKNRTLAKEEKEVVNRIWRKYKS